jgi:glycerophosphoryl diester phosphodiesterase
VVVSHEPFISKTYCLKPDGTELSSKEDKKFNLFKMFYDEIKKFDSGLKPHPRFPSQIKQKSYKPLLEDAIDSCEDFIKENTFKPILYVIEIKSNPEYYNVYYPEPNDYVRLVLDSISSYDFKERIVLKSFDIAILKEIKKQSPQTKVSLLINSDECITAKLAKLDFSPEFLGPYFELLTKEVVFKYKQKGLKIFTWTVNEVDDINLMKFYNVDGIITDFPNRF